MPANLYLSAKVCGEVVAATAAIAMAAVVIVNRQRSRALEIHKRGSLVLSPMASRQRNARIRRRHHGSLTVAGVPVPPADENRHFKIIGATGAGKSLAIAELLGAALSRGDRAVVADPDAAFVGRFFHPYRGDVILNPFEPDSAKWDLFAEIKQPHDADELALALIPPTPDASGSEWRGYARTFLGAVLRSGADRRFWQGPAELWRLLAHASCTELQAIVAGTRAQPFLDPENARMFGSIRSVAVSAMAAFEYVQEQRAAPFSVRAWVRARPSSGVLFIPYRAAQIAALKSMIATWMRLAIFETMSGRANDDQRIWFVVDELDALGAIDGLKDALARLRKFGGRCVLGFQSIAQVSGTYGAGEAQTIVENCGNTLILRCSGSEHGGTSQFASKLIGDREILRNQISRGSDREMTFQKGGGRRSRSVSVQHVIEPAVMPSEIEQLADLSGFFKPVSAPYWLRARFVHREQSRGAT